MRAFVRAVLRSMQAEVLFEEDEYGCEIACTLLPQSLRGCVNESKVDECGAQKTVPVEEELLIVVHCPAKPKQSRPSTPTTTLPPADLRAGWGLHFMCALGAPVREAPKAQGRCGDALFVFDASAR